MSVERIQVRGATGIGVAALAALTAGLVLPPGAGAQELEEIVVTARRVEEKLKEVPLAITAFDSDAIEAAAITNLTDVAELTPGLTFFNAFGENLPVPVIRGVVPQDIFGVNTAAIFVDGVYVSGREGLNFSQLDVERIEVVKGPQTALYGRNAFSGAINYVTKRPSDVFEAKSEVEAGNEGKQKGLALVSGPVLGDSLFGRASFLYDEWDGSYDNTEPGGDDIGGYRYRSWQGSLLWTPADTFEVSGGLYYSNDEIDDPAAASLPANCEDQLELTSAKNDPVTGELFPRLQNYCGKVPDLDSLPKPLDASQYPNIVSLPGAITQDSMPKVPEALGEDRDLLRANLNIRWDIGVGTLTFLTGYSDTEQNSASDFGRSVGIGQPFIYCPDADTAGPVVFCNNTTKLRFPSGVWDIEYGSEVAELSQEIRFTSPQDQRLRYSGGVYLFTVNQDNFPGTPVATGPLPDAFANIGLGPFPTGTQLGIGSYIFGPSFTPEGGLDPLHRRVGKEETDSWAVFGAMDFDVTDALQARFELRYTQESQEATAFEYASCGYEDWDDDDDSNMDADNDLSSIPGPGDVALCGDDYYDLRILEPCVLEFNDVGPAFADCVPGPRTGSARFDFWTGRFGLKYQLNSDWMVYGSVARGEKPGGLNLVVFSVLDLQNQLVEETFANRFDPEKITAYELGVKGYTADRRVGLDMAVFYNDWTDIVLRQITETSPQSGLKLEQPTAFNVNAGDARVWGWEGQVQLALTDNLNGRLTAAYTDSQLTNARQDTFSLFPTFYTTEPSCDPAAIQAIPDTDTNPDTNEAQDSKAAQCQELSGDVSGNTQMRQPEWTWSASLDYKRPLPGEWSDWDWFARADTNYQSRIYVGNDNQSYLPAHTYVNLRLGLESSRYSLEFWVRNLFEDDNAIAAFRDIYWANDDDVTGQQNPPTSNFDDFPPLRLSVTYPRLRTYGLVAKVRFGGAER